MARTAGRRRSRVADQLDCEGFLNQTLRIAEDLVFPIETITSTLAVFGGKGMGKTNFCAVLCEELYRLGLRFSLIDPVGASWGLQYGRTKQVPGIKVLILGGTHGDIAILPTSGAVVADMVADENISTVIDISRHANGKSWSMGEKVRFVTDYCNRLYERQGETRRPIMQLIDEAGRFVPQMMPKGAVDIAKCVGAIEQMVEWGRNVGIGVALITQRSARINKNVSELADAMICFRTTGPNSVQAIMDWLSEHVEKDRIKTIIDELRSLDRGSALVVSPGWLKVERVAKIRFRETFDSSATPAVGLELHAPGPPTKPDLDKYKALMVETEERAKADDPKELHRKILALQAQLRATPQQQGISPDDEARIRREASQSVHAEYRKRMDAIVGISGEFESLIQKLGMIVTDVDSLSRFLDVLTKPKTYASPPIEHSAPPRRVEAERPSSGESGLTRAAERKILTVLATYPQGRSIRQIGILAGYATSGGGFRNAVSRLKTLGYIEPHDDGYRATETGFQALGPVEPLPAGKALQEYWLRQLARKAEREVLWVLLNSYPSELAPEEIASLTETGYEASGGGFRNAVSKLRTLELVSGKGKLKASEVFFE